jgi:hypothetical protein
MDPNTTLTNLAVGGAVGGVMKLLNMLGLTGRAGAVLGLLLNLFIVALYAYTHELVYHRELLWTYFVMFIDSSVAAFSGYHLTDQAVHAAVNRQ